jgi:hypothetical protein
MHRIIIYTALLGFFASASVATAQDTDSESPSRHTANDPSPKSDDPAKSEARGDEKDSVNSELQELRSLVHAQSDELHDLRQRLAAVEAGVVATNKITAAADALPVGKVEAPTSVAMSAASMSPAAPVQGTGRTQTEPQSPLSFKIGSADFTPGGFVDFTTFFRSTNVGSGIATAFGTIPYSNQLPQARMSETRLSAQYSRLSLKVDAHLTDSTTITGYVESDFLGFQPANAYQTANSDSLRLRVYWANIRHGKWEVLGGQAWSLLTPNRVGLSPLTPDVFYTLDEDPNFQVGLTWLRQPQFRVTYHPTSNWAIAVSLENPQQFVPASVVFPSPFFTPQFDNGSGSTSAASSATNTAVPNLHPDIVVKTAVDAHPAGHSLHIEAAGLIRSFRVFNNLATPASTNTITGGGGSVNFIYELVHNFRLIGDSFYSYGGGRYIFGLGPDVIVKPDGTLSGVHSGAGLGGFEYQPTPHYTFYGYYGAAYFARNFAAQPTPGSTCNGLAGFACVGFGFPGSANTSNRVVQEATFGVIPTLWSNENYGRLQIISQYSYVLRSPWSIFSTTPPNPKNAHTNMIYLGLRYILP